MAEEAKEDDYESFLRSVSTPGHKDRQSNLDWYGGPYDPDDINRQLIEYRFAELAKRRAARMRGRIPISR